MAMIELAERPPDLGRVRVMTALILLGLLGILGRLWYLQIAHGDELLQASITNQRRLIRRIPPRGQIEDRAGKVLATNRQQIVVSGLPYEIHKNPEALPVLASLVGIPVEEFKAQVDEGYHSAAYYSISIKDDVDVETLTKIEEQRLSLPGVY